MSNCNEEANSLINTERVIRLELQRRSIKENMYINDDVIKDIDEQLAFVAQFKRSWVKQKSIMEAERVAIIDIERSERLRVEEGAHAYWDGIMYNFMQPLTRMVK
eukprot:Tbor_TRINITY_DN2240_c0_g1::TRINITY_DN2240_c0_g1_i1::g.2787::m.2787